MRSISLSFFLCFFLSSFSLSAQDGGVDGLLIETLGLSSQTELNQAIKAGQRFQISEKNIRKLANAYRLDGDSENGEFWFEYLVKISNQPLDRINYAQMLQSNGKFDQAEIQFLDYLQMIKAETKGESTLGDLYDRTSILAGLTAKAKNSRNDESGILLENMDILNSPKLDFSPTYYQGGIVFASTSDEFSRGQDKRMKENYVTLLIAERSLQGNLKKPKPFSNNLLSEHHQGPVTFSKDGSQIFFTKNSSDKKSKKSGKIGLKIYMADRSGNSWVNEREFPHNDASSYNFHPTISADGKMLFFASDRQGGQGGMDLYVSEFLDGEWVTPKNLGSKINTPQNEAFPFIHDDGTLYFASMGHQSQGNYDIYSSIPREIYGNMVYGEVTSMGEPFNSDKDDFGFILNVTGTEGYFNSSRDNGLGGDDIYYFLAPKGIRKDIKRPVAITSVICISDKETDQRIENAEVFITERQIQTINPFGTNQRYISDFEKMNPTTHSLKLIKEDQEDRKFKYPTDANGEFEFVMKNDKRYTFDIVKDGYFNGTQKFITEGFKKSQDLQFCIPLKKEVCKPLIGAVVNKKFNRALPGATVWVLNKCTGEEEKATTGPDGGFNFCLQCECEYEIRGDKINFLGDADNISTINVDCESAMNFTLELSPNQSIQGTNEIEYDRGVKIELKKIYYDYDEFSIRNDAINPLNELINLLMAYPSMKIQLSSHTDSRGEDEYNLNLSQQRADEVVRYVVARGISPDRLVPIGYGEKSLRNNCGNDQECNELQHQMNRRTEFLITSFNKTDYMQVKYLNNDPETVGARKENR